MKKGKGRRGQERKEMEVFLRIRVCWLAALTAVIYILTIFPQTRIINSDVLPEDENKI